MLSVRTTQIPGNQWTVAIAKWSGNQGPNKTDDITSTPTNLLRPPAPTEHRAQGGGAPTRAAALQ